MAHTLTTYTPQTEWKSFFHRVTGLVSRANESIWFVITFLLFILMGPFSAVPVLIGLFSLGKEEMQEKMIEPAKL